MACHMFRFSSIPILRTSTSNYLVYLSLQLLLIFNIFTILKVSGIWKFLEITWCYQTRGPESETRHRNSCWISENLNSPRICPPTSLVVEKPELPGWPWAEAVDRTGSKWAAEFPAKPFFLPIISGYVGCNRFNTFLVSNDVKRPFFCVAKQGLNRQDKVFMFWRYVCWEPYPLGGSKLGTCRRRDDKLVQRTEGSPCGQEIKNC